MALVSSLYRMVPSEAYPNRDEAERRLKVILQRLISQYGRVEVVRKIREFPVKSDDEVVRKAWLVLSAEAVPARHSDGTI